MSTARVLDVAIAARTTGAVRVAAGAATAQGTAVWHGDEHHRIHLWAPLAGLRRGAEVTVDGRPGRVLALAPDARAARGLPLPPLPPEARALEAQLQAAGVRPTPRAGLDRDALELLIARQRVGVDARGGVLHADAADALLDAP